MADKSFARGRPRDQLDLENERDVDEWTSRWQITREQLHAVVEKVGSGVKAIAAELGSDAAKLEEGPPGDSASGSRVTPTPRTTKERS